MRPSNYLKYLVLILKVSNLTSPSYYEPIGLYNDSYKIISKLVINRMKYLLPKIISPSQSFFVPCRYNLYNILITSKVIPSMRKYRKGKKLTALKVDMERAYDQMS